MIVNLITLRHLAPWVDEVMMLDTAYNAAFHGSWETTAWYRVVGQYPFSTYPPLYQMIAAVWMWLFGGSLVVVRSLNLVIAFMLVHETSWGRTDFLDDYSIFVTILGYQRNGMDVSKWAPRHVGRTCCVPHSLGY